MAVRSGEIGEFDAIDELSGLAKIVKPLSVAEAEELVPVAKTIHATHEGIGFQSLEVHGSELVVFVTSNCISQARQRIAELGLEHCRVEERTL